MPRAFGTTNAAPYAVAPPVGAEGDMYFNTANDTLYLSDGTQWIQVQGGGGATGQEFYVVSGGGSTITPSAQVDTTLPLPSGAWLQNTTPLPWTKNADGTMTCAIAGDYIVTCAMGFSTPMAAGQRGQLRLNVNGTIRGLGASHYPYPDCSTSWSQRFAIGDVVRFSVFTDAASQTVALWSASASRVGAGAPGAMGPMGPIGPTGPAASVFDGFTRRYTTGVDGSFNLPVGSNAIPLGTIVSASGATYTPNAGNTVFTIPADGVYDISAQASSYASGWPADQVIMLFVVNGIAIAREYPKQGFGYQSITMAISYPLKAGDGISLVLYTGVATTVRMFPGGSSIDPPGPYLSVWRQGTGPPGAQGIQGPVGPDIAAAQSSWLSAQASSPTAALTANTHNIVTWGSNITLNGFTMAALNQNITVVNPGRYRVSAQLSLWHETTAGTSDFIRILHYSAANAVKGERQHLAGGAYSSNSNSGPTAEALFDAVAGDYFQISIWPNVAGVKIDMGNNRSWVLVVPVGGVKGDKGDVGPDIAMAMSSWWMSNFNAPTTLTGGAPAVALTPSAARTSSGFALASVSGVGTGIQATNAGRYRVGYHLSTYGTALSYYVDAQIVQYRGATAINTWSMVGSAIASANLWSPGDGEQIVDMLAGDIIVIRANSDVNRSLDISRCYVTIMPVGGNKGDKGDKGDPGGPIATGGKPWQVITKQSTADYDVVWRTPPALGGGPTWRIPTGLGSGWSNYGGQYNVASYARKHGVVSIRGLINRATQGATYGNIFGLDSGYLPWNASGPNGSQNQGLIWWSPASNGNQLARVDLYVSGRSGGYLAASDQTGAAGVGAGWMSLANLTWMLDELNGIESGFEITVYADGSVRVAPGVVWVMGVRYEMDAQVLPYFAGSIVILFVSPGRYAFSGAPILAQFSDSSESWAKVNAQANGYNSDGSVAFGGNHLIATRTNGTWADRREWA